jgi:hypothetical protein
MSNPYSGNIVAEGRRGTHLLHIIRVDPACMSCVCMHARYSFVASAHCAARHW